MLVTNVELLISDAPAMNASPPLIFVESLRSKRALMIHNRRSGVPQQHAAAIDGGIADEQRPADVDAAIQFMAPPLSPSARLLLNAPPLTPMRPFCTCRPPPCHPAEFDRISELVNAALPSTYKPPP